MIRVFIFLLFVQLSLAARENPFFPVDSAQTIPMTSNQVKYAPMLKRATIALPSTARSIESVTIAYKNLDGSLAKKSIELENSVDWHLPIFISQNYDNTPQVTKQPPVKKIYKKINKKLKKAKYKKIAGLAFIHFYAEGKKLKVITKDSMIRNFFLVKPHRIVCDFRRQTDMKSYVKKMPKKNIFKSIKVGTHKGYYRVVIELDGYYEYKLKNIKEGFIFTLL